MAKVAILVADPPVAAPLYWLFVDLSPSFTSAFLVGGIVLLTGILVSATNTMRVDSGQEPFAAEKFNPV
ncbi:hypothetical protein [Halorubrum californiense]|uniref:hypothetical protein n=1 Tax=Halorubrum californiense TaxID=416585 RepID=UPI000677F772|nr:hypothetical protein [Halorubrum californiense]